MRCPGLIVKNINAGGVIEGKYPSAVCFAYIVYGRQSIVYEFSVIYLFMQKLLTI